jgi:hypothetical protein
MSARNLTLTYKIKETRCCKVGIYKLIDQELHSQKQGVNASHKSMHSVPPICHPEIEIAAS